MLTRVEFMLSIEQKELPTITDAFCPSRFLPWISSTSPEVPKHQSPHVFHSQNDVMPDVS